MTLELQTNSALVERIKESWKIFKNKEFPICGDYYYKIIDTGILEKKRIYINSNHFSVEVREYLNVISVQERHYIIIRAILEIFAEKHGRALADAAFKENRVLVGYT